MFKKSIFIFLLLAAVFNAYGLEPKQIAENKFANIVMKSRALIEGSPQRSFECFAIFVPRLNELTEQFETEYENCLQRSADAHTAIEEEVQSYRIDLETSAMQICGGFQNCSSESNLAYDFFQCYSIVAGESSRSTFNIQNTANDQMEYIRLKYLTVEFDQNRCTDESSRVFVEESANIYIQLERCLAGESYETPTTTTLAPTTDSTTTDSTTTDSTTTDSTTTDSTTTDSTTTDSTTTDSTTTDSTTTDSTTDPTPPANL